MRSKETAMKEDYLWDGTGEPDAETRRLESLLGGLRYQPHPLALPEKPGVSADGNASSRAAYRASVLRLAAIAAVALLTLATALWLVGTKRAPQSPEENVAERERGAQPGAEGGNSAAPPPAPERRAAPRKQLTPRKAPRRAPGPRPQQPRALEFNYPDAVAEGERAKQQLLLALHVASAKLNAAQKKVQQRGEPQS
jgi:hypothetical protein